MSTPSTARPDRYGPAPRAFSHRSWLIAAALGVAVATAWAAWVSWSDADERVGWTDIGFVVVDDSRTVVTFEVNRTPGVTVVCTVRALNRGYAEVGLVDVAVPATASRSARAEGDVPTSERAVSGTVKGCRVR